MVLSRVHNVLLVLSMHIVTDVTKQRTHVILFSIMMGVTLDMDVPQIMAKEATNPKPSMQRE